MIYLIFLLAELLFLITFMIVMGSLFYSNFHGAPWVPTPKISLKAIIDQIDIPKESVIIELGCGTGNVLRHLCKREDVRGVGVDINPVLILLAKIMAKLDHRKNLMFVTENIYDFKIHKANVVYLFLMPKMLGILKPKLESELKKGTLIISLGFRIPNFEAKMFNEFQSKPYSTYLYKI